MPEGDTLFNIAKMLKPALVGKRVTKLELTRLAGDTSMLVGTEIIAVEAQGKNLLIHFDNGFVLHTHLKMPGSWHLYLPGQSWRRSASGARVILEVADAQAVCFNAPVVRVLKKEQLRRDRSIAGLGPDLLGETFDLDRAVANLRALADQPLGIAVMNQGAVAGIGNVYKSEVLFLEQQNPFALVSSVGDAVLAHLLERARDLMKINVGWDEEGRAAPFGRTTRFEGVSDGTKVWVYRRRGMACYRCGAPIRMKRQGELQRSTYFCSKCQHLSDEMLKQLFG